MGELGKVADFVLLVVGEGKAVDKRVVHGAIEFLVHIFHFAFLQKLVKRSALFVHQAVSRKVFNV